MSKLLAALVIVAMGSWSTVARAQSRQPGAVYDFDKKGEKPGPAPKRDLSGIWEPAQGPGAAIQGKGAMAMESCRRDKATGKFAVQANPPLADTGYATRDCLKPDVEPPYTPLGLERLKAHKPTEGYRMVPPALTNDPLPGCDPQGFPRIVLHNFRTSEILQAPNQVVILYEFNKKWRVIWTDGRQPPNNAEEPTWGAPDPRNRGGGDILWVSGSMIIRSLPNRTDSTTTRLGWIMLVSHIATLYWWKRHTTGWMPTTWKCPSGLPIRRSIRSLG